MSLDRDRLLKVMALAESDADAEALAALRKARELARAAGLSLSDALAGPRFGNFLARASLRQLGGEVRRSRDRLADLEQRLARETAERARATSRTSHLEA